MLQLANVPLPATAAATLEGWQGEIDALASFPERVEAAKTEFSARNKPANKTFQAVKASLTVMCSGARRCAYCEDSVADEVEHVRPKNHYPEQVFVWTNYVYACGPCNGPKRDRFPVFVRGRATELPARSRAQPIAPPPRGPMVLVDPRAESGLDFLHLDLSGTFRFVPRPGLPPRDTARAEFTIDVLGLNARDYLVEAREQAYADHLAHLEAYVAAKGRVLRGAGARQRDLARRRQAIERRSHPTVWAEMKRQRGHYADLARLFAQAPELL